MSSSLFCVTPKLKFGGCWVVIIVSGGGHIVMGGHGHDSSECVQV